MILPLESFFIPALFYQNGESYKTEVWMMNHTEKVEKLLRDYGYPEEAISLLIREISPLSYDKVAKLILPYPDITAGK
jgi:hypothetical protein